MKPPTKAGQLTSRYNQTTAPKSAIVEAILINSPKKNAIGSVPPGLRAAMNKRTANNAFGITQQRPPSNAEKAAALSASKPATSATKAVATICNITMRAMITPYCLYIMLLPQCRDSETVGRYCLAVPYFPKPRNYKCYYVARQTLMWLLLRFTFILVS